MLRAINPNGTQAGPLPDCTSVKVNISFSDIGSIGFDYAIRGINASMVADQREIAVFNNTAEIQDTRAVLEGSNGQRVDVEGVNWRSYSGRSLWKLMAESLVYVDTWPTSPGTGEVGFTTATSGTILQTVIARAQALGELPGLTYNFTNAADSNGVAWAFTLSIKYEMGINILQVIQNLVDQGMIEVRLVGRQLQVYNPDTLGVDRSTGSTPIVLWAGRNVSEAPEQTASEGLRTTALIKGDEGVFVEISDATAVAKYGRRTEFVSQGGVKDGGTLTVIGQATIDRSKEIRSELTYKYRPGEGAPVPMTDFIPGDWVLTNMTGVLQRVRVRQVLIEWDENHDVEYTLVLNDKFLENEIMLNRRVEGITNGATQAGGSSSLPAPADPGKDTLAPAMPTGVTLSSLAYLDNQGNTFAQASASWVAVTANADGTAIDDLDHYDLRWRYTTGGDLSLRDIPSTASTLTTWSPMLPGRVIGVQVRAVDRENNKSAWTTEVTITTGSDATPPPVPSTPTLSVPFPGSVRITWNGLGSAGEAMPVDFKFSEVHISTVNNFTTSTSTLYDRMDSATISNIAGLANGVPIFVKLVSVDYLNNKSAASAQATITPTSISTSHINFTSVDIGGVTTYILGTAPTGTINTGSVWINTANNNEPLRWSGTAWVTARDIVPITATRLAAGAITVGSAVIQDAAIRSALIEDLAVTDAKIASLSVGKLTAGTLSADLTVSARIKTANTGARVELNNTGFKQYAADGTTVLVNIGTTGGAATFTGTITGGTIRTAATGQRIELTHGGGLKAFDATGTVIVQIHNVDELTTPTGVFSGLRLGDAHGIRFGSLYSNNDGTIWRAGGDSSVDAQPPRGSALELNAAGSHAAGAALNLFENGIPDLDSMGHPFDGQIRLFTDGVTQFKILRDSRAYFNGRVQSRNLPLGGVYAGEDSINVLAANTLYTLFIYFDPAHTYFIDSGNIPRVTVCPVSSSPNRVFMSITDVTYNGFRINCVRTDGAQNTGFLWIAVQP